jgi:hypothetical protein
MELILQDLDLQIHCEDSFHTPHIPVSPNVTIIWHMLKLINQH